MNEYFEEIKEIILTHDKNKVPREFVRHAFQVPGFSGAATLHLLNRCVSRIPDSLYYLEIGSHQGKTLSAAALRNRKNLVGVDNFSIDFGLKEETIKWGLYHNLAQYTKQSNVAVYPMDYLVFIDAMTDFYKEKVAVYFYDGSHDLPDQIDNLWQIKPMLCDKAIVLIDDTFSPTHGTKDDDVNPAWWDTMKMIEEDSEYELIRAFEKEVKTPSDNMGYWNGLIAMEFVRGR